MISRNTPWVNFGSRETSQSLIFTLKENHIGFVNKHKYIRYDT